MDAFRITVVGVAGRTLLNDPGLISLPGGYFVNLFMAVLALDLVDKMNARIVFGPFLLVTTMAGHGLAVDFGALCLDVLLEIGDIPVAAITGICSMNRLGKLSIIDLIPMAAEALRIIDAFITVFAAFGDKLFSLL